MADPVQTDPEFYRVIFGSFKRRLWQGAREVEIELSAFRARWLEPAATSGESRLGPAQSQLEAGQAASCTSLV